MLTEGFVWKQMLASLGRKLLLTAGIALLVRKGFASEAVVGEIADHLIALATIGIELYLTHRDKKAQAARLEDAKMMDPMTPTTAARQALGIAKKPEPPVVWFVLALACSSLTACATNKPPAGTPSAAEQQQLREIARIASVSERVGKLVESLQATEIVYHKAGKVSVADHRVIQLSLRITADTVIDALERMKDLTLPEAHRRQWVQVAIGAVDRFVADGLAPIVDSEARMELRLIVAAISGVLVSLQLVVDNEIRCRDTGGAGRASPACGSTPHGAAPTVLGESRRRDGLLAGIGTTQEAACPA